MNLATPLAEQASRRLDHPAILFEGRSISYKELDALSSRLAHAMSSRGIVAGDRVALFLPNVPEFAVTYYAAQRIGAVPVSINAIFRAAEVEYLVNDSGARVVFTMPELAGFVIRERCPGVEHVIVVDGPSATPADGPITASATPTAAGTEALSEWIDGQPDRFDPVDRAADDPAALLYSSGTTGFPKGVTLTQSNIASNVATAAKYSGYRPDDRLAAFLPMFHVYGQNYILNAAIVSGATVSLFRRFVPGQVLGAIERDRITMFFGVPTIFIGLLSMDLSPYDLSSIRYEMSAAATMPEEVSRRWTERFGRRVFEGYGLTECSPFACYNDLVEHRFGSVGRAVEGFELAIFDEEDREQPRGEWGEIVIRGPGVMKGYWNRPEDSERTLRGGWLHSGDIGRMDEDGYVYIVDRVKDMINVSGFKVWPAEVEQYLYRMPQVQELAVYGVPHPEKGEQVAVAIVPKAGHALDAEQVIAWCRESIAAYKVPAIVEIVDELPKSPTGKILKRVLREQARA
ncbi:MAG TPA: long-chain fatty acid--CoA ligase [Burkholderiaceae bacterium]|nr:long-chain fatty acid--CoA ligase [Burkholderiaceae bacterium]